MVRMGLWTQPEKLISILGGYKHEVLHVKGPHDIQLQDLNKVLSSEFRKKKSQKIHSMEAKLTRMAIKSKLLAINDYFPRKIFILCEFYRSDAGNGQDTNQNLSLDSHDLGFGIGSLDMMPKHESKKKKKKTNGTLSKLKTSVHLRTLSKGWKEKLKMEKIFCKSLIQYPKFIKNSDNSTPKRQITLF